MSFAPTPANPEINYTIQMSGVQALILQRAVQLVSETDLATIPELLTISATTLADEAACLGRMFGDLSVDGLNGFVL